MKTMLFNSLYVIILLTSSMDFCAQAAAQDAKKDQETADCASNSRPDPKIWMNGEARRTFLGLLKKARVLAPNATPLTFNLAVNSNDLEYVTLFLKTQKHLTKVDFPDEEECSTLFRACRFGFEKVAQALLNSKKVSINKKNDKGKTPLGTAANNQHTRIATLLLQSGAAIDEQDNLGYTALHSSATANHLEVVELLLAHGARADILTKEGEKQQKMYPLECAILAPLIQTHSVDAAFHKRNARIKKILRTAAPHLQLPAYALTIEQKPKRERREFLHLQHEFSNAKTDAEKKRVQQKVEAFNAKVEKQKNEKRMEKLDQQIEELTEQLNDLHAKRFCKTQALKRFQARIKQCKKHQERLADLKAKEILFSLAREHRQKKKAFARMLKPIQVNTDNKLEKYYELLEIYNNRKTLDAYAIEKLKQGFCEVYEHLAAVGYTGWEKKRAYKRYLLLGKQPQKLN